MAKCPNCGNSLFKNQFRCEKCGKIVKAIPKAEPKQAATKKASKTAEPKKEN